jgi:phosphomannomutase
MEYIKLQNGSDIRGIAIEGEPGYEVNLTQESVVKISKAFVIWLKKHLKKQEVKIAVGRDSRLSGEQLLGWVCGGLSSMGTAVTDFGMASTPAMFMSTITDGYLYDGAIMITASHLPYFWNGLKFFTEEGGLEKDDIRSILEDAVNYDKEYQSYTEKSEDFMTVYANILADKIRKGINATDRKYPLKGLHIVVDAGNGVGGFFVEKILRPLGADVKGSLFLNPDGNFPNHIPNPENPEAMASIQRAVLESGADFGIIFDTDVDRAGAVLANGEELNRNRLIAMMSTIILKDYPGSIIVTDSVTSTGLTEFIQKKGGIHHRFKRGYKNVINESKRLNQQGKDSQLAMETSGHGALKENYFLDDGAYLMVKLLIELGKGNALENLIDGLQEPCETKEIRMNLCLEDFKPYGDRIISEIKEASGNMEGWSAANNNYEGIRVALDKAHGDGWFLLRLSVHEPLMVLNIESDMSGGNQIIAAQIYQLLQKFEKLNLDMLKNYVN